MSQFERDLEKTGANYEALSPLSFLPRAAAVNPEKTALVYEGQRLTWAEAFKRCRQFASALAGHGIASGDCVAVLAPNTPPLWEAHQAIPAAGAVLNALNTRLDAKTIAFILEHSEAKALLFDRAFTPLLREALAQFDREIFLVEIDDPTVTGATVTETESLGGLDYEAFLAEGDPEFPWRLPDDEWQAISLNYTSGTTGNPKGVVYHHRGAYLNALGNIQVWEMPPHPRYLWTLPMFHCNGWCFPWAITAMAGTHVCLRQVSAETIYRALAEEEVTHLCGAPIVMQMLLNAEAEVRRPFSQRVDFMTAAAPPPASVLAAMKAEGFHVTHVYGLTEVYGPAVVAAWQSDWDALPAAEQARKQSRQGVNYPGLEGLMVADPLSLAPVPRDGETLGEVFMRGNIVMKGYLKNKEATDQAFAGDWFHSGDLGIWHPDGYIELKDRSKDIIISGGENISSIEIEDLLYSHPEVAACAVVAKPDETWGETPCAFIELKSGSELTEAAVIAFCRDNLAHFKAPRHVVFESIPKTSTGKVQKFVLRNKIKSL